MEPPTCAAAPTTEAELDDLLSHPTHGAVDTFRRLEGDLLLIGASGKIGPTLARMARRAMDAAGNPGRVYAAARFSDPRVKAHLQSWGVETVRVDLLDADSVAALPDAQNIVFMAGQKFGTASRPELAWAVNTVAPVYVAERFPTARKVVFSTGCVYANVPVDSGGSVETDDLEPLGDYANSCVGRERVFSFFAARQESPLSLYRLNYAVDLRYGVLVDVATKVWNNEPLDVTMGYANVIWQGDANARALQCLEHAADPPFILNVTGSETFSIRAMALRFGDLFGRKPIITGVEAPEALLSNASKSVALFGEPEVPLETMVQWVAAWMSNGGRLLNKPTHFERFDGKY